MDTTKYFEAKQALNKFLEEHPHMNAYQAEIEKVLDNMGTEHNRMAMLSIMMKDKVKELGLKLEEFVKETSNYMEKYKELGKS